MKSTVKLFIIAIFIAACSKEKVNTVPQLSTITISEITQTTCQSKCMVLNNGGSPVTSGGFQILKGKDTVALTGDVVDITGKDTFTVAFEYLWPDTNYCIRSYATNQVGTSYTKWFEFKTLPLTSNMVKDVDGNVYNTITIGTQVWMKENLRVTHYRNNVEISNCIDLVTWQKTKNGTYSWINNDAKTAKTEHYGALYNFYAVESENKIAPQGWHVPTKADWQTLIDYLGGTAIAGGKMKETGNVHWTYSNVGASNSSNFTALPAGYITYTTELATGRDYFTFNPPGGVAMWWSSTIDTSVPDNMFAYYCNISRNQADCWLSSTFKEIGASIRCIKD